jgi:hypothetical protein
LRQRNIPFAPQPTFLMRSLSPRARSRIDPLHAHGAKARIQMEVLAMADVVYLVIGLLFFAVMAGYAVACERL